VLRTNSKDWLKTKIQNGNAEATLDNREKEQLAVNRLKFLVSGVDKA